MGGTTPYTYAISAGALPNGLTLNTTTGAITGTPTVAGNTYSFTVKVFDAATPTAQTATQASHEFCRLGCHTDFELHSARRPPRSESLTPERVVPAPEGQAPYTYSISAGALPNGLTLNSSTGAITGTPTGSRQHLFVHRQSDGRNYADRPDRHATSHEFCRFRCHPDFELHFARDRPSRSRLTPEQVAPVRAAQRRTHTPSARALCRTV